MSGQPEVAFEEYVELMRPWAERLLRRRAVPTHPFLSREDLLQEGLVALWRVWETYRTTLSQEGLCRLGTTAMRRRILDQYDRAWSRGRGRGAGVLSLGILGLTEKLGGGELTDELLLRVGMEEISRTLSGIDRSVLGEVLRPGVKTLRLLRRVWGSRMHWSQIRTRVLAAGTGYSENEVRGAWGRLRCRFQALALSDRGNESEDIQQRPLPKKEERAMKLSLDELAPPEPTPPDAPPDGSPKPTKDAKTLKSVKKKEGQTKQTPSSKKKERETKQPPPSKKKEEGAKRETLVPPSGKHWSPGTRVRYLGGSHAKGVTKGQLGTIKKLWPNKTGGGVRYGIRFDSKRYSVMAARYVEKV